MTILKYAILIFLALPSIALAGLSCTKTNKEDMDFHYGELPEQLTKVCMFQNQDGTTFSSRVNYGGEIRYYIDSSVTPFTVRYSESGSFVVNLEPIINRAVNSWQELINGVTFRRVANRADSNFIFEMAEQLSNSPSTLGLTRPIGQRVGHRDYTSITFYTAGFSRTPEHLRAALPTIEGRSMSTAIEFMAVHTVLHEIGHGLGLAHTNQNDLSNDVDLIIPAGTYQNPHFPTMIAVPLSEYFLGLRNFINRRVSVGDARISRQEAAAVILSNSEQCRAPESPMYYANIGEVGTCKGLIPQFKTNYIVTVLNNPEINPRLFASLLGMH